jgi:hypothetical protein
MRYLCTESLDPYIGLLLDFPKSAEGGHLSACFPSPAEVIDLVRRFSSSIVCSNNFDHVDSFLGSTINLAAVFIRHGQYEAAQVPFSVCTPEIHYIYFICCDVTFFRETYAFHFIENCLRKPS